VFVNQQLDGLSSHKRIYDAPSHTEKIFGNMKRVDKGFSGRVTPLFPTMVVQNQAELGEGSAMPTDPHHTPTIIESSTQPQKTQKPKKPKRKDSQELMELCTNLQQRVLDLEKTKTTQAEEINSLKRRVKKLEQKRDDAEVFDVNTLTGDEVFAEQEVAAKDVNLTIDEVTLAQALAALKNVKSKDNGKGIMVEEPVKTIKKKDLIRLDEETAKRLQAKFDEEERHARETDEANVALIKEWDAIQDKIEVDHELAQRLQAEEQEELFVEEKAKLF
ncbi:hypothetical protein Tco_1330973, partial [Tanacetum coccineum]